MPRCSDKRLGEPAARAARSGLPPRSAASDERGVALVLTLFIVALVSVLVLEYHFEAAVELDLAHNYGSDVQAYHVALSGMRLAQELLAYDDSEADGPQDAWHRIGLVPACMPPQAFLELAVASALPGPRSAAVRPDRRACRVRRARRESTGAASA